MSDSSKATSSSDKKSNNWKPDSTIKAITTILTEIIEENINDESCLNLIEKQKKSAFCSRKPPSISIEAYIERIIKYTHLEEPSLVIALIYIDRICEGNDLLLTHCNIHRILFTSIVLAIKFNEDDYYSNNYYAKVGGVSLQETNSLEYEMLKLINFKLFVAKDLYEKYHNYLIHYHVKN